ISNMLRKVITTTLFVCFIIITLVACDHQTDTKQQSTDDEQQTNKVTEEVVLPDQHLQKGDQGKEVQHIQTYLTDRGDLVSGNGTYEERREVAIVDLQLQLEDDELDVTGMYDQDKDAAVDQSTAKDLNLDAVKMLKQPTRDEKIVDTQ